VILIGNPNAKHTTVKVCNPYCGPCAAAQKNETLTTKSLDDWYLPKEKNYEIFAAKYPLNGEIEKQGEKISLMKEWCEKTKIQFTPTFFIDEYQMPTEYKLTDLQY